MKPKMNRLLSLVFFIGVLVMNYLATSLPLGGKTTGELSDNYPNLFTPAGFTFAIWGVIYLALLVYIGSLLFNNNNNKDALVAKISPLFILSCVFNMLWIVLWHYQYIALSVVVMLGILYTLFSIVVLIKKYEKSLAKKEVMYFKIPFGLYFGWIIVATVANITALLVHIGWSGFGISEMGWTATMLLVATAITAFTVKKMSNVFIGFSVLWALFGIINKRFDRLDVEPFVVLPYLGIGCMVVLTVWLVFSAQSKRV